MFSYVCVSLVSSKNTKEQFYTFRSFRCETRGLSSFSLFYMYRSCRVHRYIYKCTLVGSFLTWADVYVFLGALGLSRRHEM